MVLPVALSVLLSLFGLKLLQITKAYSYCAERFSTYSGALNGGLTTLPWTHCHRAAMFHINRSPLPLAGKISVFLAFSIGRTEEPEGCKVRPAEMLS